MAAIVLHGDCIVVMRSMLESSIDVIVTDPPYGLEFMGKEWDSFGRQHPYKARTEEGYGDKGILLHYGRGGTSKDREHFRRKANINAQAWHETWAREALRVLKPGGHLLAFGGTRTYHRLTCALEDAGFEIRDCLMWLYGSGFPKSHSVPAALDRLLLGKGPRGHAIATAGTIQASTGKLLPPGGNIPAYEAESDTAKQWSGWGTALKPAWEPIILARKPLSEPNVAANVLRHGTGALNIDASRIVGAPDPASWTAKRTVINTSDGRIGQKAANIAAMNAGLIAPPSGRWPANVLLDVEAARLLDEQIGDAKGASRFFYCAKASQAERTMNGRVENSHPTVKPLALMRYLIQLITPPGALVLDPFAGSGSTLVAAESIGISAIGIEQDSDSVRTTTARLLATR